VFFPPRGEEGDSPGLRIYEGLKTQKRTFFRSFFHDFFGDPDAAVVAAGRGGEGGGPKRQNLAKINVL
jgi:hypothetical protein